VVFNQSTPIRATQPLESQLSPGFSIQRPSTATGHKIGSRQYHPSSISPGTFSAEPSISIPAPLDSPNRLRSPEQIDHISNQNPPTNYRVFRPSHDTHYDQAHGGDRQPNPSLAIEHQPRSQEWSTQGMIGASISRPSTSIGFRQDSAGKTPRQQGLSITSPTTIESSQAYPMSQTNSIGLSKTQAQKENSSSSPWPPAECRLIPGGPTRWR